MIKIDVTIKGLSPLLMNNPQAMYAPRPPRKVGATEDPKKAAEKTTYRTKDNVLYIPYEAIQGTMIVSSKWLKSTKPPMRNLIAAVLNIQPEQIPVLSLEGEPLKTIEVDGRRVVIQPGKAIIKHRAMIPEWQAAFSITYNPEFLPFAGASQDIWHDCLERAGLFVGILDFRPQHLGKFGRFEISQWDVSEI